MQANGFSQGSDAVASMLIENNWTAVGDIQDVLAALFPTITPDCKRDVMQLVSRTAGFKSNVLPSSRPQPFKSGPAMSPNSNHHLIAHQAGGGVGPVYTRPPISPYNKELVLFRSTSPTSKTTAPESVPRPTLQSLLLLSGLSSFESVFNENHIGLDIVGDLSESDLISLGLSLGQRRRLQRAVVAIHNVAAPT